MKKRIIYSLGCILGTFVLYKIVCATSMGFENSNIIIWDSIRYVFVSAILTIILCTIFKIWIERKRVKPYISKLFKYRYLLYQLVKRDFNVKYKRSVLGVLWSVLNPLLTMTVLTIVFSTLFRFDIDNYPVYLLSGQIIFTLFTETTNTCMFSIISSGAMMKKVNMPKYIFPLSRALSSLVNFVFSLFALLIVMIFTGCEFKFTMLLMIIPILYAFVFSTGVGMIIATAVVYFRDMSYLYGIFITALTYFTPLFYPISIIPDSFRWIISLNPMYHFVECFRTITIYGAIPNLWQNIVCMLCAAITLEIGIIIFYKKQDNFILYI